MEITKKQKIKQHNYRDKLILSLTDVDKGGYEVNYSESSSNSYRYEKLRTINADMEKNDFEVTLRIASLTAKGSVAEERDELPENAVEDAMNESNCLWRLHKSRFNLLSDFYDFLVADDNFLENIYNLTMSKSRPRGYVFYGGDGNTLCSKLDVYENEERLIGEQEYRTEIYYNCDLQKLVTSFTTSLIGAGSKDVDEKSRETHLKKLKELIPSYEPILKKLVNIAEERKKVVDNYVLWELCSEDEGEIMRKSISEFGTKKFKDFVDSMTLPDKEKEFWKNYIQDTSYHRLTSTMLNKD